MKAVILAGGLGTRLSEETELKPKPMIQIGGKPILWHILKIYSHFGINDFVICCGYKGYMIKEYFVNYYLHNSDVTFDIKNNDIEIHQNTNEPWKITLIDTGDNTMTGGRIKRIEPYVNDETFCLTYGDGVADINISELIEYHKAEKKIATLTAVQPPGRFGALEMEEGFVTNFREKSLSDSSWINGGFFVLEPSVFSLIEGDEILWEKEPLEGLAKDKQLVAFKHKGFWHPMDTLRDKRYLENLWTEQKAPWKLWK